MSKKAKIEHRKLACLWPRAISPYMPDKQSNTVEIHEAALWITPRFDEVLLESKMGYSDGTRGVGEVPLCIRPAALRIRHAQYTSTCMHIVIVVHVTMKN